LSLTEFAIGQRWVSNSEAELGLGLIKEVTGRRIEVLFPAAAEQRTYASNQAPLSRVLYQLGDKVTTNEDVVFTISERHELNGCYVYQGESDHGDSVSIHEMDLSSTVQFNQPQDRLLAGQVDKNSQFQLRLKTLYHQHRLQQSYVYGLMGARVQLLPHQFYIASQVAQRVAPRVLLADEVGLGKTIEAGLILHQQLISGRAQRALIVVPDSLVHQWLVEMLRRFNMKFSILDEERYQAQTEFNDDENPFETAQLVLCSLSSFTNSQTMLDSALAAEWDLMIVDEAHHLQWSETDISPQYQVIEQLAAHVAGLLLLTATPEQLGVESHFARLRLLDSDRYFDLTKFVEEEQNYHSINELLEQLLANDAQANLQKDQALQATLTELLGEERVEQLLTIDDFELIQSQAVNELLDRHGTGRVLYRNTRNAVAGFPQRILHQHPLTAPVEFEPAEATILQQLQAEKVLGESWLKVDPRVDWLVDWLKQNRQQKVLLICANAETAQDLEALLRVSYGMRSSVFHEGMSLVNRDRAAAYFADDEDGAQILICSEIGSEGRNFQFASHLILFDLPLNPDLLEQRIGRLDRIGQGSTVNIHVPYFEDTAQQVLMEWYHQGVNAFERVMPAGSAIYHAVEADLTACLNSPDNSASKTNLIKITQQLTEKTLSELQQGRNRLLELNSCNKEVAEDVLFDVEEQAQVTELVGYMNQVFDEFGVDQQVHSSDSIILQPGNQMLQQFPELPEDGLTATYHRYRALSREDMHFLSWEHPMILGAMDMISSSDFGNSAFCTLETSKIKAGTLLIEAVFKLNCAAPKSLQTARYLDESYIRVVCDEQGRDLSQTINEEFINQRAGRIPKATTQQLIAHARENINTLSEQATKLATQAQQQAVSIALTTMDYELSSEYERLHYLTSVNPNIRPIELTHLLESKRQLGESLKTAQLAMDAMRVIITTN
jgi:ATP-dependent helicase HepA